MMCARKKDIKVWAHCTSVVVISVAVCAIALWLDCTVSLWLVLRVVTVVWLMVWFATGFAVNVFVVAVLLFSLCLYGYRYAYMAYNVQSGYLRSLIQFVHFKNQFKRHKIPNKAQLYEQGDRSLVRNSPYRFHLQICKYGEPGK